MIKRIIFLIVILSSPVFFDFIFAEPILITSTDVSDRIVFDGKWTDPFEWKESSLNIIFEPKIYIRSSHQGEFIYFMIDVLGDRVKNSGAFFLTHSDRSMICFDRQNNKSQIPDDNDYCFIATLGTNNGITLQGGSSSVTENYFKKIQNHEDFIAIGGISDHNDRYSKKPHVGYEFRIPIDVIGRSDNYGFLLYVYDYNKKLVTTWPNTIEIDDPKSIPSPSQWSDLISPDKSLPEFDEKMILFSIALLPILLLSKFKKDLFNICLNN